MKINILFQFTTNEHEVRYQRFKLYPFIGALYQPELDLTNLVH